MINEPARILESRPAIVCWALLFARIAVAGEVPIATQSPSPWLMFHHDENHTGVSSGRGNIDPTTGPIVHWTYRVTAKPETSDFCSYRWYSSFPLGDLDGDGDGALEAIVHTDCKLGSSDCPGSSGSGALYVFRVSPGAGKKSNPPIWWRSFPAKLDSAEPAVADLDAGDGRKIKALIMGSWAGRLYVVWRNPDGKVYIRSVTLDKLDPSIHSIDKAVVRSSPLVWKFVGGVWSAVFGWMPDNGNGREGRISAVDISANMKTGAVTFTPKWTVSRADWKSSVSLLPVANPPLVVTGYGIGLPAGSGTGNYGLCCKPNLGGVLAIDASGAVAWERAFEKDGNIRGSTAVGDVDGDGRLEVILTGGCTGKVYAFDGATGAQEWSRCRSTAAASTTGWMNEA